MKSREQTAIEATATDRPLQGEKMQPKINVLGEREVAIITACAEFKNCDENDFSDKDQDMYVAGWLAAKRNSITPPTAPVPSEPVPQGVPEGDDIDSDDLISIPRGLVGAACYVIRKDNLGSKLLEKLREYTTGKHSTAPTATDAENVRKAMNVAATMGNVLYNLAQRQGYVLTDGDCEMYSNLRKEWDAIRALISKEAP